MGLRGPQPKPTAVRIREGNPSRRPLNAREPDYACGIPARPKSMSSAARLIWDDLIAELDGASNGSVLRTVDARALWHLAEDEAMLSMCYAGVWGAVSAIRKKAREEKMRLPLGALLTVIGDKEGRHAMAAVRDLSSRVMLQRREFGLTPASRSRLNVESTGAMPSADSLELKLCG